MPRYERRSAAWVAALLLLIGCGDDDGGVDSGVDAAADMGVDTFVEVDAGDAGNDAGPRDCASILSATNPFAVAPDYRRTQIHPSAAFDGERIWLSLTVVDEPGPATPCVEADTSTCETGQTCSDDVCSFSGFDIALMTLECDGTPGAPSIVSEQTSASDIDSAIAINGAQLMVAWQRDEGTGMLGTVTRAYGLDATPASSETPYVSIREGAAVMGTVWFPMLNARSEGGFWMWGTRGLEVASSFQVYLQQLDAAGAAVGESSDVALTDMTDQSGPVLVNDGADMHFAWTQDEQGVYLAPGASDPAIVLSGFVASSIGGLARQADRTIALVQAGTANATINLMEIGQAATEVGRGRVASPFLATDEASGGAVLWLADTSGFVANEMWVRRYDYDGSIFTLGAPVQIPTLGSVGLPYRPSIMHLTGDFYFATWAERSADRWEVFAQILELP